ncbi:MAG TPA: MFS transporter, partial [Planctomycetota bacterium]|nr:MFS transporter [Planctomycetota bacterium]
SELVPRETLELATRLRSTVFQIGSVVGRSISGFIYAGGTALGLGAAFTYGVVSTLLVAALLMMAAIRRVPCQRASEDEPMLASLAGGVRFVTGNRVLFGAMLLDLLGVLFGDAIILLPIFADQIFHLGPQGLGLLRAAPAAGAVVMALLLMGRPPFVRAGRTLLIAVAVFGVSQAGFALSPWFPLAALFLALGGAMDFISVVVRNAMLQVMTPPHLLGRVTSVQQVFIWSSNELGALESGAAARLLGLVPSVVAGGLVTLVVTAGVAWRNGQLRRLGRIEPLPVDTASPARVARTTELVEPVVDDPEVAAVR